MSANLHPASRVATLEPLRFAEYLREKHLISDEQWLAALADHWSSRTHGRIGETLIAQGVLPTEVVEDQARVFHDELDVLEIVPRAERVTIPIPVSSAATLDAALRRTTRSAS